MSKITDMTLAGVIDYGDAAYRIAQRLGTTWPAGSRLPSVRDLAQELGVANATAHRAVRILAGRGFLITRPRAGVFVAPTLPRDLLTIAKPAEPSAGAAGPLTGLRVAVFHGDLPGEDLTLRMISGFQRELAPQGCVVSVHPFTGTVLEETADTDALAVFNVPVGPSAAPGRPLIVVTTSDFSFVRRAHGYDIVSVEQEQGGMIAGQTLRQAGATRVCCVGRGHGPDIDHPAGPFDATSARRFNGFIEGWGGDPEEIDRLYTGAYGQLVGALAVRQFVKLPHRPDGVFAASDEIAMGFVNGAAALGLRAGKDYLIVGFDGQRLGQEMAPSPLTTVEVFAHEMGRRAGELLTDRLLDASLPVRRISLGCGLLPGRTAVWQDRAPASA